MNSIPNCSDVYGRDCSQQSFCISSISTIAPALFYLPTSLSVAWRSDAQERPDNPLHFLRPWRSCLLTGQVR